ncbi:fucolectin-like [Triplophysa dalaica]|uniref:fucolectin-like n=1 Tax=Triplophysa dalaica TaxID=1582913 RepID=UPI0024DF4B8F|nr:fucolectin-like [Triplophysa dalaica]
MLGRYVNVFMPGRTTHLSLCEVEVYGTENLASKGTVTQSSTAHINVAEKAKDGLRYDGVTCTATNIESNPWWRLDLLHVYDISTVIITTRSDCCSSETNGVEIRIGNSLDNNGANNLRCAIASSFQVGHTLSYSCHGMSGRYVNVVMTGQTNRLSLCEVEVYGTENLAFKGTATQTSTYLTWIAQYAVDGVRYGAVEAEHCSSTSSEGNPWWRLDLQDYYEIDTVIIAPKPSCCPEVTNGAEICVGNSLVNNGNNNPM